MDDESQPLPRDKAELMERIESARGLLVETIGRLSPAKLIAPGLFDGWSVKDHLSHVATWERSLAALLQGRPRYAAMNVDRHTYASGDTDAVNALIFLHTKERRYQKRSRTSSRRTRNYWACWPG